MPAVLYIVLYAASIWLLAAVLLITILALLEYNNLSALKQRDPVADLLSVIFGVAVVVSSYWCASGAAAFIMAALFTLAFAGMVRGREQREIIYDTALKTLGIVYIALPLSYFVLLGKVDAGQWWIFFLLGVIWTNDSLAYFTGRAIGRRKLSPVISPNKTVEGAVGGIVGGVVVALVLNGFLGLAPAYLAAAFAVMIGLVAIVGDLVESVLKRSSGAKDSGSIVPGHGGVLDRIDSIIFPLPMLYYMVKWLL